MASEEIFKKAEANWKGGELKDGRGVVACQPGGMPALDPELLQSQRLPMDAPLHQADNPELYADLSMCAWIMRDVQAQWLEKHPNEALLLPRKFPTKRSECFKIPYGALEKTEDLVATCGTYRHALSSVLGPHFPTIIQKAISHIFLNYLSPNQDMIAAQGRHLFMLKAIELRNQIHCWFIPAAEVAALQKASSEDMRQGISYNDLALVQTYTVEGVLALHAEMWGNQGFTGRRSASSFGECRWIGGSAFHYGTGKAGQEFAQVGVEAMPELAAKKAKEREKRQRKRANQKKKKAEKKEVAEKESEEQEAAAAAQRRRDLAENPVSLADLLLESEAADGLIDGMEDVFQS